MSFFIRMDKGVKRKKDWRSLPYCEKKRVEFPLPQSEYRGRGRLLHIEIFDGSESGEDQ